MQYGAGVWFAVSFCLYRTVVSLVSTQSRYEKSFAIIGAASPPMQWQFLCCARSRFFSDWHSVYSGPRARERELAETGVWERRIDCFHCGCMMFSFLVFLYFCLRFVVQCACYIALFMHAPRLWRAHTHICRVGFQMGTSWFLAIFLVPFSLISHIRQDLLIVTRYGLWREIVVGYVSVENTMHISRKNKVNTFTWIVDGLHR